MTDTITTATTAPAAEQEWHPSLEVRMDGHVGYVQWRDRDPFYSVSHRLRDEADRAKTMLEMSALVLANHIDGENPCQPPGIEAVSWGDLEARLDMFRRDKATYAARDLETWMLSPVLRIGGQRKDGTWYVAPPLAVDDELAQVLNAWIEAYRAHRDLADKSTDEKDFSALIKADETRRAAATRVADALEARGEQVRR